MTYEEMQSACSALRIRCERLDNALRLRANNLSGLGEGRNVWTNAIIAKNDGRPWDGVDYSSLRRAIRIDQEMRRKVWAIYNKVSRRYLASWDVRYAA